MKITIPKDEQNTLSKIEKIQLSTMLFIRAILIAHLCFFAFAFVSVFLSKIQTDSTGILLIRKQWKILSFLTLWSYLSIVLLTTILCLTVKRLMIVKRIVALFLLWIPLLHILVATYVLHLASQDIDRKINKISLDNMRIDDRICQTKYPLLLLHGIGFRDYHYMNYWGRIPKELIRNGATIFYGHQEAWGTFEQNGEVLKNNLLEILEQTGAQKVNIIAHSKGGVDARYLISALDMGQYVASLTTLNAPHRGSKLCDFLTSLPRPVCKVISKAINHHFRIIGDKNPDAFTSGYQISEEYMRHFNEQYTDDPRVYYQSYTSLMSSAFSSKLLLIPYLLLKTLDGPNDGMVTPESAKWGNFRTLITTSTLRGVSHGDIIDLTREDLREFDVIQFYIQLVAELKEMGY